MDRELMTHDAAKLDAREQHVRIPSPHRGRSLFLRDLTPSAETATERRVVLYVQGGRPLDAARPR